MIWWAGGTLEAIDIRPTWHSNYFVLFRRVSVGKVVLNLGQLLSFIDSRCLSHVSIAIASQL